MSHDCFDAEVPLKLASHVEISDDSGCTTKRFTSEQFQQALRASNFVAIVSFWRRVHQLANPEPLSCLHAGGLLREIARRAFDDCQGLAFSHQQEECFRYCGLTPTGVRPPGSLGREEK
jgi:hypothetical protein